jgi:fumarate reductase subunit D
MMHGQQNILPLPLLFAMLCRKLSQSSVIALSSGDISSVFPMLYVVLPTRQAAHIISNKIHHFSATPKLHFSATIIPPPLNYLGACFMRYFSQNVVCIFCSASQIVIQRLLA